MRNKFRLVLAGLIFLLGISALVVIQVFIPIWITKPVVTVARMVPSHALIAATDLAVARMAKEQVPERSITDQQVAIGKKATVDLVPGVVLTEPFVDVDELLPGEGQVIFPVPRTAIFSVNGSLRAKDMVDILLYLPSTKRKPEGNGKEGVLNPAVQEQLLEQANGEEQTGVPPTHRSSVLMKSIRVVGARSEAGNMILDTELGNTNERLTATDRIGAVELLVTTEQAEQIKHYLEQDYLIWFVRAS